MASKEDILEQLVEEFLIHRGYFVRHNVKFLPRKDHADFISKQDSNHNKKIVAGREAWKGFRELVSPKWSEAFISAVQTATREGSFTHVTAVTKLLGDRKTWEMHAPFRVAMASNPIKIVTLHEMLEEVYLDLKTTLAGTEPGRMLQLFRAAGVAI